MPRLPTASSPVVWTGNPAMILPWVESGLSSDPGAEVQPPIVPRAATAERNAQQPASEDRERSRGLPTDASTSRIFRFVVIVAPSPGLTSGGGLRARHLRSPVADFASDRRNEPQPETSRRRCVLTV